MTRAPVAIGIIGFGKIARDQHLPALQSDRRFVLHSIADTAGGPAPVRMFASIEALLSADDTPAAVAVCTPPQARYAVARRALERGRHVLLEKPPATTLAETDELREMATRAGLTLFCAWHSRFAPAVEPAREWLAGRALRHVRIHWREDVRLWHPGQRWLWEPGGFGVFDPGINALSVITRILPKRLRVREALLRVPENCDTPIAANLRLEDTDGTPITATFDFLHTGPQTWTIEAAADTGVLVLSQGGARLSIDGRELGLGPHAEYPALYAHFAELIASGRSDADTLPLRLVADAFLLGRRLPAPPFVA
jgi:D-galactose 1-dehydrogenase